MGRIADRLRDRLSSYKEKMDSVSRMENELLTDIRKNISDLEEIIENDLKAEKLDNSKITILSVHGLLTEFARSHNANCIIRGLRAVSDFEYEFQMTGMNYQLSPNIETVFLMSSDNNSFISSNLVKEVHKLGGDVSKFVSKNTIKILNRKNS